MNRSAQVIKMLNYLKVNGLVSRKELATYLETNTRNILEYKKELELAGYYIESVRGKKGGYYLDEQVLIPTLTLTQEEQEALRNASIYLHASNFQQIKEFDEAYIKIKSGLKDIALDHNIHYLFQNTFNHKEQAYARVFMEAKEACYSVKFSYCKLGADIYEKRLIQPYALIYSEDGCYVLGYDATVNKKHVFKTFKISSFRMQNVEMTNQQFVRNQSFEIQDYVGKQNIIKEAYEVELKITGKYATLLYEKETGILCEKNKQGDILYLKFTMENKMKIIEFILSLGNACEIIRPLNLKNEVIQILSKSLKQYML